jgi:hypothetical protein
VNFQLVDNFGALSTGLASRFDKLGMPERQWPGRGGFNARAEGLGWTVTEGLCPVSSVFRVWGAECLRLWVHRRAQTAVPSLMLMSPDDCG